MAIPELQDTANRLTDCIYFGDPISSSVGSGFVPTNRTISTTLPLTGGGDFSTNRTFAINDFAGSVAGAVPPSLGGTTQFLRADGTWNDPVVFTDVANGYTPASGGGTTNYLRADGTWASPAGASISGLTPDTLPLASSPTSLADSKLAQTSIGFNALLGAGASGGDAGLLIYGDGTEGTVLTAYDTVGGAYVSPLVLHGGGVSAANIALSGDDVTIGPTLNVSNTLELAEHTVSLSNGLNSDINLSAAGSNVRAIGPTAQFSVGGFVSSSEGILLFYNTTAQTLTIVNEDLSSTAAFRITTLTGADVTLPANGAAAIFQYSTTDSRWILLGTNPPAQYPRIVGYLPYEDANNNLASSPIYFDVVNGRFGIYTASPKTTLDIAGAVSTRPANQSLSNGLNSDIPVPASSYMRVLGPTGAFSVGGIAVGASESGRRLTIHNTTSQAMTIVNEDLSSTAAYRINTLVGANVVFPARQSVVHLVYSSATGRWILEEANPVTAGGATTQVQHNLNGALSGDTGLVVAGTGTAKTLTIGTDVTVARKATRHLELGTPGASPAAYTLAGNSAIGGTDSNKVGGKLSIGGGSGTGTGGGGDTALVTAYPLTLGNTQNPHVDRLVYAAKPIALTDSAANDLAQITVGTESGCGGTLWYTLYATDGTDMQILRGRVEWGAINKASAITVVFGTPEEVDCTPTGTLTVTVAAADNGDDTFTINATPVSSLVTTSYEAWISVAHDGRGAVSVF